MTRIHDMGGRFGDGPVTPAAKDAPVFATVWHARALAVTLAAGGLGQWNIDMSRHRRERLSPQDYAGFSYYEKWIAALADLLVDTGVLTLDDLQHPEAAAPRHPLAERALTVDRVGAALAAGGPALRPSDIAPLYKPGDHVRCLRPAGNRLVAGGHTRLPGYAAGVSGKILRFHGCHVLPDASAHGLGDAAKPLYSVVFRASDLWVDPEHPDDDVVLDLWQSYLEPVR